jgi:hypothetical protein
MVQAYFIFGKKTSRCTEKEKPCFELRIARFSSGP